MSVRMYVVSMFHGSHIFFAIPYLLLENAEYDEGILIA